ncbi:MAG TPA: hypothetical protein VN882_09265 [Steroidobacteraceae bacterium]|jgi:hypothetical protein|nr:hypothetical protein [Steroidobacteraceae bacterium]
MSKRAAPAPSNTQITALCVSSGAAEREQHHAFLSSAGDASPFIIAKIPQASASLARVADAPAAADRPASKHEVFFSGRASFFT